MNGEEWSRGKFGSAEYTFGEMIAFACEGIELAAGDVLGRARSVAVAVSNSTSS